MFGGAQKQMRITENPLAALDDDMESEDNNQKSQETWARDRHTQKD